MLKLTKKLAITAVCALIGTAVQAQTTTLRYSNWLPVGNALRTEVIEPWIEEVGKVTEGRVRIDTLPKVVGSLSAQFDVGRDGQADIVVFVPGYTPGRFPISEVIELPFMGDDPSFYGPFVDRFYRQHLQQYNEFKGMQILSVFVPSPGQLFNNKHPLKTIEDFKGLKLRSPQPNATMALGLLGATPVAKPVSETYELLSSGVLDGTLMPPESISSFKLVDKLPYGTIVPGGLYNTTMAIGMNERKWNALTVQDREAIMKISGELFSHNVGLTYLKGDEANWAAMRKIGSSIDIVSPEVIAEMQGLLASIETEWIKKVSERGLKEPEKLIQTLKTEVEKARKAAVK